MTTAVPKIEPGTTLPLPAESGGWFGPLFYWEMTRESRKGNSYLPRVVYTSGLLLLLYLVMGNTEITQKRIAHLCTEAFTFYLVLQYLAVVLLTPAYVSGAIIEDRQQRTFSLLLTTHLTPREIILGKMMGRLMPMLAILLAGLPVLAILQLLGGISMGRLAFHSIFGVILVITIGMHAIRASTECKTVGGAVLNTYGTLLGIGLIIFPFCWLFFAGGGDVPGVVVLVICIVGVALFLFAWIAVENAIRAISNRDQDQDFTLSNVERVEQYMSYQEPVVMALFVPAEASQTTVAENKPCEKPAPIGRTMKTYTLGDWPIIWKEVCFPSTELVLVLTAVLCGLPFSVIFVHLANIQKLMAPEAHSFFIGSSHFLMTLLLMLTTLRAAGTFVTERKRQTLISLLTTPLSWNRIILEFWFGSFWRYRWLALGTLMVALWSALYDPLGFLATLPAFVSQLAFFAMLGVASSLLFQSAFQARLMLCVFFLFSYLVLPWLKSLPGSSFIWMVELLLAPYRLWSVPQTDRLLNSTTPLEQFTIISITLHYLVLIVMIWSLTYLLFRFSRYRLGRLLDRGGVWS